MISWILLGIGLKNKFIGLNKFLNKTKIFLKITKLTEITPSAILLLTLVLTYHGSLLSSKNN